jgi:hypothetical protein
MPRALKVRTSVSVVYFLPNGVIGSDSQQALAVAFAPGADGHAPWGLTHIDQPLAQALGGHPQFWYLRVGCAGEDLRS